MRRLRRDLAGRMVGIGLLAFGLLAGNADVGAQQAWPTRPVKWIVPFAAGGATDALARLVAREVEKSLGQPIVVENRPGGNTFIAVQAMRAAPADGYTMMVGTKDLVIAASLHKPPFDVETDLECVGQLSAGRPFLLIARPDFPASNAREAAQQLRASGGKATYASYGNGSISQLAMEIYLSGLGTKLVHVPYKGAAPALQDIMGSQVDVMADSAFNSLPLAAAGKIKVLGILGRERFPELPDVLSAQEAGVPMPANDFVSFIGLLVAKGTPAVAIETMSKAVESALQVSELRNEMTRRTLIAQPMSPAAFCTKMHDEYRMIRKIVEDNGIQATN